MDWKFVLVLIFSLLVAVFTMQNAEAVNVQFLTFEFTHVSQALVILTSAVAGALIAVLFGAIRWVKDKSKLAGSKKSIAGLETQVKQLKIMLDAETAKNVTPAAQENVETPILEADTVSHASEAELVESSEEVTETAPKRKWYQI